MYADAAHHGIGQGVSMLCEHSVIITGVVGSRDPFRIPSENEDQRITKQLRNDVGDTLKHGCRFDDPVIRRVQKWPLNYADSMDWRVLEKKGRFRDEALAELNMCLWKGDSMSLPFFSKAAQLVISRE
jgi:hypothetical protein